MGLLTVQKCLFFVDTGRAVASGGLVVLKSVPSHLTFGPLVAAYIQYSIFKMRPPFWFLAPPGFCPPLLLYPGDGPAYRYTLFTFWSTYLDIDEISFLWRRLSLASPSGDQRSTHNVCCVFCDGYAVEWTMCGGEVWQCYFSVCEGQVIL